MPRPRLLVLALLAGAVVASLVYGAWIAAQARAVVVLSTTLETPVLTWLVTAMTDEPRVEETVVAGVPATLARPGEGDGPWPAIVFVNGATPLGRREPDVQGLARGLARAGYLVVVPDLPGLAAGRLSERTLAASIAVARSTADRPDARGSRVGLVGVSVGASLALLTAEDAPLAERISVVAGVAPYADLAEMIRLATTGLYRSEGRLEPYATDPFLGLVAARSLVAALPPSADRRRLAAELARIDDDDPSPLAFVRGLRTADLGPEVRATVALLANRDPLRFDRLYGALPAEVRSSIARLSPLPRAELIRAPVELASSPRDKYFPITESRALVRVTRRGRLTVTGAFAHAIPRPSLTDPGDVLRFDLWAVRSLYEARG